MATCVVCGKEAFRLSLQEGKCMLCAERERRGALFPDPLEAIEAARRKTEEDAALTQAIEAIILTTEASSNLPVVDRLGIVTAECVYGMNVFKDIASSFRDIVGGRSKVLQTGLRDARETTLAELRKEAFVLGADAVVAIDLDYSQISEGGRTMLILVASGTAVTLGKLAS